MTAFGKILTILNLVVAVGMATWAIQLYSHRPGWFEAPVEGGPTSSGQVTFKQLTKEIDDLGKSATAASATWGTAVKGVEAREKLLKARRMPYAVRLEWARKGTPRVDKQGKSLPPGPGFFEEPGIDVRTKTPSKGLTDLSQSGFVFDKQGNPVPLLGPDSLPLRGADTLLDTFHAESDLVAVRQPNDPDTMKPRPGLIDEIKTLRDEQGRLQKQIVVVEVKLLKQLRIREDATAELLFLRDFRITVGGQRDTVYERKKQLEDRIRSVVPRVDN